MAQTQADRKAAAKKAAITRERNKQREQSQEAGVKGAATRQGNEASASATQAKQSLVGGVKGAVRAAGDAAKSAGKAVSTRSRTKD